MAAAERMEGRRVLVYATHTGTRDITERMDDMLTRHGFRVAVMKADAVAPERREACVADRVKQGIAVMICHPRLAQTGLDLVDFPTIVWYETDYSVYTMRQASRRSWRIGQTRPVKVVFMAYRNTLQSDALKLVAKKLQSSLAVEGELPEDGLAAYGDDGDDLMMALARQVISGDEEDEAETVDAVFAQARDAEAASEEYLVDDGWKLVEVEPETVSVNGNGMNGANGHHANSPPRTGYGGIGPTVELVLDTGHVSANGNGHAAVPVNGHSEEAPEPQRSLFSWAEFMAEEPVKPKGRGRKPQPVTLSMFEWALTVEQEREEESVAAGRPSYGASTMGGGCVDGEALRVQSRQHQPLGAGLRRRRSGGIGAWSRRPKRMRPPQIRLYVVKRVQAVREEYPRLARKKLCALLAQEGFSSLPRALTG